MPSELSTRFRQAQLKAQEHWQPSLQARLTELYLTAEQHFQSQLLKPALELTQRGTSAGSARLQSNLIRLNPVLLCESPEEFIRQILPHELAHLLVHQLYGKVAPHGNEWKYLMAEVFGLKPERTHRLDTSLVQGPRFFYRCGCQQHQLTIRRHNKIQKGVSYRCRACQQELYLVKP